MAPLHMSRAESGGRTKGGKKRQGGGRDRQQQPPSPSSSKGNEDDADMMEGGDDAADDDEDYVFDPADFPMLEGDFFGTFDDDEMMMEGEDGHETDIIKDKGGKGGGDATEPIKKTTPAKLPIVAVIGRPNVGKSTIVNRLCRTMSTEPDAIVYDYEGVTRDRIYRT